MSVSLTSATYETLSLVYFMFRLFFFIIVLLTLFCRSYPNIGMIIDDLKIAFFRRGQMEDRDQDWGRRHSRVPHFLPESGSHHQLHFPCDCLQQIWDLLAG